MARGRPAFRESDLTRALRAVTKAGLTVYGVSLKDGEINLILHEGMVGAPAKDEYDQWRDERRAKKKLNL